MLFSNLGAVVLKRVKGVSLCPYVGVAFVAQLVNESLVGFPLYVSNEGVGCLIL